VLKSEIQEIRRVLKPARLAQPESIEQAYFGRLPDGRWVSCSLRRRAERVEIYAREQRFGDADPVEWITQFSASDWSFLSMIRNEQWETVCRLLVLARTHEEVRLKLEAFRQTLLSEPHPPSI
jgi:hypothetical protein